MERVMCLPTHVAPGKIEHEEIFENEDLQLLWGEAYVQDTEYARIKGAIADTDTTNFSASLGLQAPAHMSEAKLTSQGNRFFRGTLWIPHEINPKVS